MDERHTDTVSIASHTANSGSNNIVHVRGLLVRNWTRISIIGIFIAVAHITWKVWESNRGILRLREAVYEIPFKYRQRGSVIVHLLTIVVTGSFLTLALFSHNNAQQYIWWYAFIVIILAVLGLLFPQGHKNNGR